MNSIEAHGITQKWNSSGQSQSCAKVEGWKRGREDENQISARSGACMWIFAGAVISKQPEDMVNFKSKLYSFTDAINKTWDFICDAHEWLQQCSMELQECKSMKSLQYDIEVPCIMQWRTALVLGPEPSERSPDQKLAP